MGKVNLKGTGSIVRSTGSFFIIMFIILTAIDYFYDIPINLSKNVIQAFLTAVSFTLLNAVFSQKEPKKGK